MCDSPRWRMALAATTMAVAAVSWAPQVWAQAPPAAAPAPAAPALSALDAPLFYQLLIGEMELRSGEPGTAFEVILDAARRTQDEALFRRAVDIALQGRAGDKALVATRAWRTSHPESLDALRLQLQVLLALNRPDDMAEPLRALLKLTPDAERGSLIAALPRFLQRSSNPKQMAGAIEDALKPYADADATRVPVRVASGHAWLNAGQADRALALAQEAHSLAPDAAEPALLALELMAQRPAAEGIVTDHLARPAAEPAAGQVPRQVTRQVTRLAYVRALTGAQRYADAVVQLQAVTREQPGDAGPYLTLGALQLELKHAKEGEAALLHYIELAQGPPQSKAPNHPQTFSAATPAADDDEDDDGPPRPDHGVVQAWLMLAQAAESRGDFKAAEGWLARVEDPKRALEVQTRRASILGRQGKYAQARELIRRTPERSPEDARAKLVAEAGVLREVKRWGEAFEVLAAANQRFADDSDLLYEQAMMAEKLERLPEMERLLRRVIELKPDNAHAHNALGYSLADRSQRLPEARTLIQHALELSPADPFITDSLGWLEFRAGNRAEAVRLLRAAYAARPDTEIGAHLGEVLWSAGQHDEARRVWREVKTRDQANEVLRETLARLRVSL